MKESPICVSCIFKPKLQDPKSCKILDKISQLLLENRIYEYHYIRKNLESSIKQTTHNLSGTLTEEYFTQMRDIHSKTYKHELEKNKRMTVEETDLSSIICMAKPLERNITRKQSTSLKSLQQIENIIILPADKRRATVVLDKEDHSGIPHLRK